MNADDKEIVMSLVSRLPEHATLLDLAHELERATRAHPPAPASASRWLIGQACREECHRQARDRAEHFAKRLRWVYAW